MLQGGLIFVCGSRESLMEVSGRRHNADDVIATVLAVEPTKFVYRGRYVCQMQSTIIYKLFVAELHRVSDVESRSRLRSASSATLIVRPTLRSSIGDRSFAVAAARTWNSLPPSVTASQSLQTFRKRLKTELFQRSYTTASLP